MFMLADHVDVVIGVDTHRDTHTAAVVLAATGAVMEEVTISTDPEGYARLLGRADEHGGRRVWSVEGAGAYGAGLARFLAGRGEWVVEADRPHRPARRNGAKSDALDAVRAGREVLSREHLSQPRAVGPRAALAVLLAARRSAVDSSAVVQHQLNALVVTAPESLRTRFRGASTTVMLTTATRLRVNARWDLETRTYAVVLCAWSHPGRCRNEAAFANLAGVAPLPASSGLTTRHRLNRRGDRQLNRALHVVVLSRLRYDPVTRAYVERRRAEGKTDREIKRCLKRYIARQLYRQLEDPSAAT